MAMALDLDVAFLDRFCRTMIRRAAPLPWERYSDLHNEAIDMLLDAGKKHHGPHSDIMELLCARLHVGVTEYFARHRWGRFDDVDELRNILHGSFHIPVYCRALSQCGTNWVVDGAFSFCPHNDLPQQGAETLVMSVVGDVDGGWCDVHPQEAYSKSQCLLIPCEARYSRMCAEGREATDAWLREGKLNTKSRRAQQHLALLVVWVMRAFEEYAMRPYVRSRL
jgi:hypothetical protein